MKTFRFASYFHGLTSPIMRSPGQARRWREISQIILLFPNLRPIVITLRNRIITLGLHGISLYAISTYKYSAKSIKKAARDFCFLPLISVYYLPTKQFFKINMFVLKLKIWRKLSIRHLKYMKFLRPEVLYPHRQYTQFPKLFH